MTNPTSKTEINHELRAKLEAEAIEASRGSYAPYSHFHVGAAVLGKSGRMYRGANIENASYGLGTCAERVALANAKLAGEAEIVGIVIACVDAKANSSLGERMPCGACRQWIKELAPTATIIVSGVTKAFTIDDLLPNAFTLGAPSQG
jgi:cytidine deaminase